MAEPYREPDQETEENAPLLLQHDLREVFAPPQVPAEVDQAVFAMFREEQRRRWVRKWTIRLAGPAVAAALLVAAAVYYPFASTNYPAAPWAARTAPQGDILDAFCVAKQLDSGLRPGRQWDATGDGVVDRRDVDAWAAAAVSLKRGS